MRIPRPSATSSSAPRWAALLTLAASALIACQEDDSPLGRVRGALATDPSIDFGTVQVGLDAPVDLPLRNTGNAAVRVVAVEVAPTFTAAAYAFEVAEHELLVGAADERPLRVTFRAFRETEAPAESSFTLVTDLAGEDGQPVALEVHVRGRGVRAGLAVEPNPVDFGGVRVGSSRTIGVTLTNRLSAPIDVASRLGPSGKPLILPGTGHGTFEIASRVYTDGALLPLGTKLDPGASVTVDLRYTPDATAPGEADAARWVASDCASSDLCWVDVDLTGHGIESSIGCGPSFIDFGRVDVGRTATADIVCQNLSSQDLAVTGWHMLPSSARELTLTPFPSTAPILHAGETITIAATFTPTRAILGRYATATMGLSARAAGASVDLDHIQIPLAGLASGAIIAVTPAALDFGEVAVGTTNTQRLLVQNLGLGDLVFTLAAEGPDAPRFLPSLTAFTLPTGTSTVVAVAFAPTAEGVATADLALDSNDVSSPRVVVPLFGTAVELPPCSYVITPVNVGFGVVPVSQTARRTVRIQNQGADECLVGQVELTGDVAFALPAATDPLWPETTHLAAGAALDLPIDFTPPSTGPHAGRLALYVSSPGTSNPVVPLYGVGVARTDVTCPAPVTTPAGVPVTLTLVTSTTGTTITSIDWEVTSAPPGGIDTPGQWAPAPPSAATETFLAYIVGTYLIRATVTDNLGNVEPCMTYVTAEGHGLRVQLTWDGPGDVDLHVHNGHATPWFQASGQEDDCYYGVRTPLWNPSQPVAAAENPQLDFDNIVADGPENTRVNTVVVGRPYTIAVHNFSGAVGRIATVDVFCGSGTAPTRTFVSVPLGGQARGDCTDNDFWKVATVVFTTPTTCVISPIDTVAPSSVACTGF